jgi:3-deoxy-manno-octulosonate cytidylyltransferase (CMP-KDO synthetase)
MAIIPARYGSQRLPGKPLLQIRGKSMIQRVCEQVARAGRIDHFCVATDDILIYNHVKKLGYDVIMTRLDQPSGTYRCAEVLASFPMVTHVVNVQGDEPLVDPRMIDQLAEYIIDQTGLHIATLVHRIEDSGELGNPNVVKAVISRFGDAMYFSRQPVPYVRDMQQDAWLSQGPFFRHVGMYAYTREALLAIEQMEPHPYERMERLEQLTWLANGMPIHCLETTYTSVGVDTEDDLKRIAELIAQQERQS